MLLDVRVSASERGAGLHPVEAATCGISTLILTFAKPQVRRPVSHIPNTRLTVESSWQQGFDAQRGVVVTPRSALERHLVRRLVRHVLFAFEARAAAAVAFA